MRLKKFIIAFVFSMVLAISSIDSSSAYSNNRPPIIFQIHKTPDYSRRKKPLKVPRFSARNQV